MHHCETTLCKDFADTTIRPLLILSSSASLITFHDNRFGHYNTIPIPHHFRGDKNLAIITNPPETVFLDKLPMLQFKDNLTIIGTTLRHEAIMVMAPPPSSIFLAQTDKNLALWERHPLMLFLSMFLTMYTHMVHPSTVSWHFYACTTSSVDFIYHVQNSYTELNICLQILWIVVWSWLCSAASVDSVICQYLQWFSADEYCWA